MSSQMGNKGQVFYPYCDRTLNMEQNNTWGQCDNGSGDLKTTLGKMKFLGEII